MNRDRQGARWMIGTILLGLVLAMAGYGIGCGKQEEGAFRAALSLERSLYPPLELARVSEDLLIALVAEGDEQVPVLYRSTSAGRAWQRWLEPPIPLSVLDEVDLAQAGTHLALAGREGRTVWAGALALETGADTAGTHASPSRGAAAERWQTTQFTSDDPIESMAIACAAPDPATMPQLHLLYVTEIPGDTLRTLWQRRSPDAGATWTAPELVTDGAIGGVATATRPDGSRSVDVCYQRDSLLRWRGLSQENQTEEFRLRLRVAPESRNRLARFERNVLASGESERHQAVAAFSENVGRNWSSAIALARDADHPREPDIDAGYGLYWVAYLAGDSLLVARAASTPKSPRAWSPGIWAHLGPTMGQPYIVAMPDSSAGILHAAPEGRVYFTRVWKP